MVGLRRHAPLLAVLCACASTLAAQVHGPQIRAGAARTEITPDLRKHGPVYMAGFDNNRIATGIHDPLYARCLALSAAGQTLVLCGVDSIGLFADDVEQVRADVKKRLATQKKSAAGSVNVVVAATHDHQAPDTMGLWGPAEGQSGINEAYNTYVVERVAQAAADAVRHLKPAIVIMGQAHPSDLDTLVHDDRPPEVHDAGVIVLRATTVKGDTIGTLVNWANHPETLGSRNTLITADYPQFLCSQIEQQLDRGERLALGAGVLARRSGCETCRGHQATRAQQLSRRAHREARGPRLRRPRFHNGHTMNADRIEFQETRIEVPISNPGFQLAAKADLYKGRKKMTPGGASTTPVGVVRLFAHGKPFLEIALVPGELYPELSVGGVERYSGADFPDAPIETPIKQLMTADFKMLVGLADDEIGYIIPKAEWDEKEPWLNGAPKAWYGEVNSVGPEAAPLIVSALEGMIRK
jgi:hypothetical protein